jgi:hypothetical protein
MSSSSRSVSSNAADALIKIDPEAARQAGEAKKMSGPE